MIEVVKNWLRSQFLTFQFVRGAYFWIRQMLRTATNTLPCASTTMPDGALALGSDAHDASVNVYLLLKAFGKSMGLDELRKGLGMLIARTRPKPWTAPPEE